MCSKASRISSLLYYISLIALFPPQVFSDSRLPLYPTSTFTSTTVDPLHPNLITSVPYKDCGSKYASLTYLEVYPPCGPEICKIPRGEPATLIAHFDPSHNVSSIRVQVDQIDQLFGFSTHLLPEFEPCGRFNVSCPIVENERQYSIITATLPKSLVPVKINLKVIVYTEDYEMFLCLSGWMQIV